MKKSDEFIKESVFRVNLDFLKLQNKTKELYFECLNEGRSEEYFNKKLEDIWGNTSYSFMDREINEYRELIHENNMQILELEGVEPKEDIKKEKSFLKTATKVVVAGYVTKLVLQKKKEYKRSLKSEVYKQDKKEYLKKKVQRYDSAIVPYYVKKTGKVRHVELSTYVSMVHNTNLTRTAWDQTLNDADTFNRALFYIPYHSFSCSYCIEHQGKIMTRKQVEDMIGIAADDEVSGDILHPNCKCTLQLYTRYTDIERPKYSLIEQEEQYEIRQKVNSLTLEKERIKTDMKIQKELGNIDEYDELNQKRNKINAKIRDFKNELPTAELQKQVVAINRNY
jgi:hypothetical protein